MPSPGTCRLRILACTALPRGAAQDGSRSRAQPRLSLAAGYTPWGPARLCFSRPCPASKGFKRLREASRGFKKLRKASRAPCS